MKPGTNGNAQGLAPEIIPREKALSESARISPKKYCLEELLCGRHYVARRVRVLKRRPLHSVEGVALTRVYEIHVGLRDETGKVNRADH